MTWLFKLEDTSSIECVDNPKFVETMGPYNGPDNTIATTRNNGDGKSTWELILLSLKSVLQF